MKSQALTLLLLTIISSWSSPSFANNKTPSESLLVGTWVLCNDPDHGPFDSIVFFQEGYGFVIQPLSHKKTPFLFKSVNGEVLVMANVNGALLSLTYSLSPGVTSSKSRLLFTTPKLGHRSLYVRKGMEKENACTAKPPTP